MGKIVKYCNACEESFAEKFSFCPNCASDLSTFEMKPLAADNGDAGEEEAVEVKSEKVSKKAAEKGSETAAILAVPDAVEDPVFEEVNLLEDVVSDPPAEPVKIETSARDEAAAGSPADKAESELGKAIRKEDSAQKSDPTAVEFETAPAYAAVAESSTLERGDNGRYHPTADDLDDYAVTVISETNGSVKNGLMLGSFSLIVVTFFGVMIYSLFSNLDDIPALNQDPNLIAYLDDSPIPVEEMEDKRESDDKSGGGGGGGKEEPKPASEGVRPPMMKQPTIAPSSKMTRMTDPELKIQAGIQGPIDEKKRIPGRYGIPGSISQDPSDGRGSGGGIGSGTGRGVGSGNGTGFGSGDGSGMGSGSGDGIGDGSGSGNRRSRPPARASGPSTPFRILSKPRPGYTESARKNNVTGMVRLRVTFNSNGTIGSITPISRLGHGLTEQAIAAARGIRFSPQVVNGRPLTVKKTVIFNFTIY